MATIVDSYSETNSDNIWAILEVHPSASGSQSAWGQSFTGDGQNIYSCKFYAWERGSPGNCIARLYAHSGTYGTSSVPTGNALDSSSIVAGTLLSDEPTLVLYEFTGFTGYTLVSGTKYCIVLETVDGLWDGSNLVAFGSDISSPTHGGNAFEYKNSAWGAYADGDLCFYVYGVPAAFIPRFAGIV